jgi:hypothetical protein
MANEKNTHSSPTPTLGLILELAGLFAKGDYSLITVVRSEAWLEETSGQLSQQ